MVTDDKVYKNWTSGLKLMDKYPKFTHRFFEQSMYNEGGGVGYEV